MIVFTDAELVESTQSGDEKAFETLVEKHRARIDATISAFIDNTQDREDIAQETFITAYRNMHQLSNPDRFRYWLVTIARNQCRDWIRRNQSHTIPIDEVDENLLNSDNSPERESIEAEQQQIIAQAIETLPETERRVASAYYLEGESHEELISRHGISYQAVCARLSRAKQKLAKRLGHLLTGVFVSPVTTLKQIYSGGLTVMKVGTVPKITAGVAAIIVLVFIGTRQFISSKEESPPSVEVVTSTPTESANSVAQRDATPRKDVVTLPSREDKPQISAEEMGQIEDFFAQLDESDARSEANSSQLLTDAISNQNSESGNVADSSVASEGAGLSAEELMNTYVDAYKNFDFEALLPYVTETARQHIETTLYLFSSRFSEEFVEGIADRISEEMSEESEESVDSVQQMIFQIKQSSKIQAKIREMGQEMYGKIEIVSSKYAGDEFHFRLRVPMPKLPGLAELPPGFPKPPEHVIRLVKMRKVEGMWIIYERE